MVIKMCKDIFQFCALLIIFIIAYGVATQGILYPNEWRVGTLFYNILYTPYLQIYGELFMGERTEYAFEDHLSPDDGTCNRTNFRDDLAFIENPRCPNRRCLYMKVNFCAR